MNFRHSLAALLLLGSTAVTAQLTSLPSGGNKIATVGEQVGLTQVTIHYNRPGVKGREGKIYGTSIVHTGFQNLGFGPAKASPWRAGANENTTIEFSTDVMIEGKPLQAGKYGFFVAYDPVACTLIFSNENNAWGSYYYDESQDALRVKVTPVALDQSVEWLQYRFIDQQPNSTVVALEWEKLRIPFTVTVDYPATQLAIFRKELVSSKGFKWEAWQQAAQWCLQNDTALEQGLAWSDSATGPFFGGGNEFQTWATRTGILEALGRKEEAASSIQKALQLGDITDLHNYGRHLIAQQEPDEAMKVFSMNYKNHPKEFTALMGMARGYAALKDYKKALKFAQQALPLSPDDLNKKAVEDMIAALKEGKDIH